MPSNSRYNLVAENPQSTVVAEYAAEYRTAKSYQSEAGLARQQDRGWRKALYCALSDGEGIKLKTRFKPGKRKDEDLENLNLMDILKGEK